MSLFGVVNVHEPNSTEKIEFGVSEWLKWGLLEGGAFLNVGSGSPLGVLRESPRPGITPKTLYQSARADWLWESGVAYTPAPTRASGVWVDGAFRAFGSGCVPDYPGGSVTFSPALTGSPSVTANYSCRTVRVYTPRNAPWYYQIQWDSFDPTQTGSGTWSPDGRNRLQLPAVFVRASTRVGWFTGVELGTRQRVHSQDVEFDVVSELPSDRDRLHDALVSQWEGRFQGIDLAEVLRAGRQPLTAAGNINPSGVGGYPDLSLNYPWTQLRVVEVGSRPVFDSPRLFVSSVRWRVECDLPSG